MKDCGWGCSWWVNLYINEEKIFGMFILIFGFGLLGCDEVSVESVCS